MAFDFDKIRMWYETWTGRQTTHATSFTTNKKFSDVANYVREGKFMKRPDVKGQVATDRDSLTAFTYEYLYHNSTPYFKVRIEHSGEKIKRIDTTLRHSGAAWWTKEAIRKLENDLEDYDGTSQEASNPTQVKKIDYSEKTLSDLLEIMDTMLQEFSANASATSFSNIISVKDAMDKKINAMSLAEKSKFSAPLSNLNMYINTIKTQMSIPGISVSQFTGTYIPQMQAAISEMMTHLS